MVKSITVISIAVLLSGCSGFSTTVPVGIDDAVRGIEKDIRQLGYLSISDLLSDNEQNKKAAETYVRSKQCFFGKSNPILVFALQSSLTFELKGAFTQSGSFKIVGIPTPSGETGISTTKQSEQLVSWPVLISSLSALPDQYLEGRIKVIATTGLTAEQIATLSRGILDNYTRLKTRIDALEKSFDSKTCTTH